jgi:sugar phosphate permease
MPYSIDDQPARPSHVRYVVVALAALASFLLYLDRFCPSVLERYIKEDLRLSDQQIALLFSAFFWSYALGQVPSGWLGDHFGARLMLGLYILLWSLFTGLMGVLVVLSALVLLRLGCGLAQAGAYPTSGSLLSKWVPFSKRGQASSIVALGGRVGGALAPLLTAYLMLAFIPSDLPSLLGPDDVLDAHGLCQELGKPDDEPSSRLGRTILASMPPSAADWVRRTAAASDDAEPIDDEPLREGLNDVLTRPELYNAIDVHDFALEPEARELARAPGKSLTSAQIERRNRLLLEAAFPRHVRKLYGSGWRPVMLVYGLVGVVAAGVFWLSYSNWPRQHPRCNAAEIALIEGSRPRDATSPHGQVGGLPLRYLLRSRSLWLSSLSQFATNWGWIFLLTWLPRYLDEVHHVPIKERGWMALTPTLVGIAGMFCGGWLTDRLVRDVGLRWGRRLPMALTRFSAMAAYLACLWLHSPWPVVAALALVALSVDLGTGSVWAFTQDVGGRHVGSVLGWGNMWGSFGAAVSIPLLDRLVAAYQPYGWDAAFVTCAAAFLVSGIAALGVDATAPIVPPGDDAV